MMTKTIDSHPHSTAFHGFGRFRGATYCGTWNALDQPECTLLEVLLIDLDDSVAYANSLKYISENGFHNVDSTILMIAIACHLPGGSSQASTLWKDDLDRISRCVPTLYVNSQARLDRLRYCLKLLSSALQGKTLRGLRLATVKSMLGSYGTFYAFCGWGTGTDRIRIAWEMAIQEAAFHGCEVSKADNALAVIGGQMGDLRLNESTALDEIMLGHFHAECSCEVATSFGTFEANQSAVTLFLR